MKKNLICLVLLYFLFFNSANAIETSKEYKEQLKTLNKELKAIDSINQCYLDKKQEIYILQVKNHKFKKATETLEEIVKLANILYSDNFEANSNVLLQQIYLYLDVKNPKAAKQALEQLKIVVDKADDEEITKKYYKALFNFYSTFESPYKAKEVFQNVLTLKSISPKEQLENLNYLITASHGAYNVQDTIKYFNDYYNLNIKLYGKNNESLIPYYRRLLEFKLIVQSDYKSFIQVYENLAELTAKYGCRKEEKIKNTLLLIDYYFKTNSIEKAKVELDKINIDVQNSNNYYLNYSLNSYYLNFYIQKEDKKNQKIYKNKLADLNKSFNKERVVANVYFNERLVDYYKFQDNYKKAEQVSNEILDLLEEFKDDIPIIYGKFLKNNALIKRDIGEFDGALNHLYKSENSYLKELPEISYPIYETTIELAILHMLYKRYYEAIPYYKKAKNICLTMFGKIHRDTLKVSENMANNYFYAGLKENAIKEIDEAIFISINLFGEDNPKVIELKDRKNYFLK